MRIEFQQGDVPVSIDAESENNGLRVRLPDGSERQIAFRCLPDSQMQVSEGRRTFRLAAVRTGRGLEISYRGQNYLFTPKLAGKAGEKKGAMSGLLAAPMVGVVADVLVTNGQEVAAYQPLVVVEAMKVMASLDAPFAGIIRKVHVVKGQRVVHGEIVIEVAETAATENPLEGTKNAGE